MENTTLHPSPLAHAVVKVFETKDQPHQGPKIVVNKFVSEIASWYEKLRNAMEFQDEEIILKNSIERILKRRLLLGGTGEQTAEPLLRELVWARYFADNTLPQSLIHETAQTITVYLSLKHKIISYHKIPDKILNDWMFQLMSCDIARLLNPDKEKEAMSNFMFHILQNHIVIHDDSEDTKNVQVYLAVRRAFAKDDLAFLRYYLFRQIFPQLTHTHIDQIAQAFLKAYTEINQQLQYRLKEKIYLYVKRQTPIFFILEDAFRNHRDHINSLIADQEKFGNAVFAACNARYKSISERVRNAIIRSVFFLLLTKVIIAYLVEGTYDNFRYGHIMWKEFLINIISPPLLMIIVSFFIKTPGVANSRKILEKARAVLFEEKPRLAPTLTLSIHPQKTKSFTDSIFALLWIAFFGLSFGLMIWILTKLHFNYVSELIFIFFITIVSFLSYRIQVTAHAYTVEKGQGLFTPFIDILFLPVIKVGMQLTEGISQINILIFIFDFLIEAPFKVIFGFFEGLFVYVHTKREDLE